MATESLEKLKLNRKSLRASVTKLVNNIDTNLKNTNIDTETLEENLSVLKIKSISLKDVDKELEPLIPLTEYENEKNTSYEYEDKISIAIFRAQKKLKENATVSLDISSSDQTVISNNKENKSVKLPKLIIPRFSGDCTQYTSFWNTFRVTIHENASLTNIEKFNYLRSYLTSAALNAIEGLEISEINYEAAIKILETRFGQKDIIINHHMNKLLNLTPVFKCSDILSLKKMHESIEINVRALSALGLDHKSYSAMLIAVVLKILPANLSLEWNRKNANNLHNTNIHDLLNFIQTEIISRERTFTDKFKDSERNKNKSVKNARSADILTGKYSPFSSTHEFIASVENQITDKKCLFCKRSHKSELCKSFDVEKRKSILKEQGRCFLCLQAKHRIFECTKNIKCRFCGLKHSETICYKFNSMKKEKESEPKADIKNEIVSTVSHTGKNKICLQTCCVKISNRKKGIISRLLMDCGSMRSFLTRKIADKLNLNIIRNEKLAVFTFGNKTPIEKNYGVVKVTLEDKNSSETKLEIEALVTDEICGSNIPPPPEISEITKNKYLQNLTLSDSPTSEEPITLLVGADYYYDIVLGNIKRINKKLVAVQTVFGWCLQGIKNENPTSLAMNVAVEENGTSISEQIKQFWDLETSGLINSREDIDPSEGEVMRKFESEIGYKNSRYEVKLPWKLDKRKLHDNRKIAENRFLRLKRKFVRNPELFFEYKDVLQNYLSEGIIEPVSSENNDCVTCYLPHREVIKRDRETSKLRIVFDASSHDADCISLNSCLHVGPNLYEDILYILFRFRFYPVAFTADVKKAFLQIVIQEDDRDVTRFLFVEDPFNDSTPLQIFRFRRVLFGLNSSPFLLAATIKHHLKKFKDTFPATVNFLNENIYVDDVIGSHPSVEKALSTSVETINIFQNASMHLHKWHTNSRQLHELWVENKISDCLKSFEDDNPSNKVLGLGWDNLNDSMYFDTRDLIEFITKNINTKRFVLQVLGRIFDPIGFLGPFTVRIKCLMQEIWSIGLDWDEELPDDLKLSWGNWCEEVPLLSNFSVPRYFFSETPNSDVSNLQLHLFSDSSMKAFGTVAYFRFVTPNESIRTVFVASKNRVAPLKKLTLPRLELMGALLSAKLCNNILKALKIDIPCFYWTDSKITYFWIRGSPEKFKPFVKNRVEEIRKYSAPSNWHHCPGTENPSDLITRGVKISKLIENKIWLFGPEWLSHPPEFWPKPDNIRKIDVDELEYNKKSKEILQNECIIDRLESPIDICKFSNLEKLLRVTAWVKRFITNLRNTVKNLDPLTAEEIIDAENFLIRGEQKHFFKEEYEALKNKNSIKKESPLLSYMPLLDENELLRLGGRLEFCDLSINEKHPLILSRDSWLTTLIVRREHGKTMHGGTASTLAKVRSNYWIPKGRQFVKKIIKGCLICRKYLAKPADQITAPLPSDRTHQTPVFSVCGLDFAGPLYVKNPVDLKKSYIVLFTCGVSRALHLELVSDMTTDSFLLAFRRFLSRRGNCKIIYSDNAKTFQKGKKEIEKLSNILVNSSVKEFISKEKIIWKNIAERSPWWGGFYERLVKSVKECLHKILGKALLNFEEMTTVLTEVEAVLNLRPLSYVYGENDEPGPLTPMHFINFGQSQPTYPVTFAQIIESESERSSLLKRRKYQLLLLKQLWKRFKEQYLLDLRTAHSMKNPTSHTEFKVGDVVLIEGNTKNKLLWKLGKIERALPGRDNKIRCYELKTSSGLLRRTVQHLYPFELYKD